MTIDELELKWRRKKDEFLLNLAVDAPELSVLIPMVGI